MIGWDYGNARVAALRCHLLDGAALRALGEAESGDALVARLAAMEEWRPLLAAAPVSAPRPADIVDAAIERHRSGRLSSLLRWYGAPERRLVEAVVMSLDLERVLAVLRRRRARGARAAAGMDGPDSGTDAWRPVPGALLDAGRLARLATSPGHGGPFRELARLDLLERRDAAALAEASERGVPPGELEASLHAAWDRARSARAVDARDDGELVRAELARERRDRAAVRDVLLGTGAADAAALERRLALERMERLARRARRQPLGIAPVLGYHAALEHQALLLRAMSVRAGGDPRVEHAGVFAGGA